MKHNLRLLVAIVTTSLTAITSAAQTSGSNSPYSRYGWGTLADESMGFNKAMGGLAQGMRDGAIINRQNPAALSEMDSLTFLFDAGISLQNCLLKAGGKSLNAQNSTVDYLAAGFRLGKGVGFTLGLRPFSYVGYDFSSSSNMDDIDGYGAKTTTATYNGTGGFRQLFAGVGWKPVKPLSVGLNVNYTWGDYTHNSQVSYSDASIKSLSRTYQATINSPTIDFGVQYEQKFGKKDKLTVGATYGLGHKINQRATLFNTQTGSGTGVGADTTVVKDAFGMPNTISMGFAWNHANQWTFGADYTIQFWEKCDFPALTTKGGTSTYAVAYGALRNRHKVTAGVEYIPNPRSLKVRDHICYRAGVSYSTPYTKINYKDGPDRYLVTCGVALPIVNKHNTRSVLNLSAQWEHADASDLRGIKEDYLRLSIGLTFNATWFNKWKFE